MRQHQAVEACPTSTQVSKGVPAHLTALSPAERRFSLKPRRVILRPLQLLHFIIGNHQQATHLVAAPNSLRRPPVRPKLERAVENLWRCVCGGLTGVFFLYQRKIFISRRIATEAKSNRASASRTAAWHATKNPIAAIVSTRPAKFEFGESTSRPTPRSRACQTKK